MALYSSLLTQDFHPSFAVAAGYCTGAGDMSVNCTFCLDQASVFVPQYNAAPLFKCGQQQLMANMSAIQSKSEVCSAFMQQLLTIPKSCANYRTAWNTLSGSQFFTNLQYSSHGAYYPTAYHLFCNATEEKHVQVRCSQDRLHSRHKSPSTFPCCNEPLI
jgi:hypothetical protein